MIADPTSDPSVIANERAISDVDFRTPRDLERTPASLRRVVVIGSCLAAAWPQYFEALAPGAQASYVLFNNVSELPDEPPVPSDEIDFAVVQFALRGFLPEAISFGLAYDDLAGYTRMFEDAVQRLLVFFREAMRWNARSGMLTFVANFIVPQQDPMGRLFARYDLRNPVFYVEELNRVLQAEVEATPNAFTLDLDQIASSLGKRYIQDDVIWQISHGAVFTDGDFEQDRSRIEPPAPGFDFHGPVTTRRLRRAEDQLESEDREPRSRIERGQSAAEERRLHRR